MEILNQRFSTSSLINTLREGKLMRGRQRMASGNPVIPQRQPSQSSQED